MDRSVRFLGLVGLVGVGLLIAAASLASAPDNTSAAEGTTVSLLPSSQNVDLGDTFTVDVAVDNATNLAAYEFRIKYDPNILRIEDITETDFLRSTGRGVTCPPIGDEAARTTTDAWFGCYTDNKNSLPPVGGSGVLAHIRFSAIGPGLTYLTFVKLELADDLANDCCAPFSWEESAVRVIAPDEPKPDHLPATPTHDRAALTPTPNPAAPTSSTGPSWLTPEPGETSLARPLDGSYAAGADTSGSGASGGSGAGGGAQGTAGGSPRAGTGPPEEQATLWPTLAAMLLASGGAISLSFAFYLRRAVSRRRT